MAATWPDIQEAVVWSLRMLDQWDRPLLLYRVNERSVSHKFAEYLRRYFDKKLNQRDTPYLSVDCEYNRRGYGPKRLPWKYEVTGKSNKLYYTPNPDVTIHCRGNDDWNLFVVEMKLAWNADVGSVLLDKQKLAAYMDLPVDYAFGLFLCLGYSEELVQVVEAKRIEREDGGDYRTSGSVSIFGKPALRY